MYDPAVYLSNDYSTGVVETVLKSIGWDGLLPFGTGVVLAVLHYLAIVPAVSSNCCRGYGSPRPSKPCQDSIQFSSPGESDVGAI